MLQWELTLRAERYSQYLLPYKYQTWQLILARDISKYEFVMEHQFGGFILYKQIILQQRYTLLQHRDKEIGLFLPST